MRERVEAARGFLRIRAGVDGLFLVLAVFGFVVLGFSSARLRRPRRLRVLRLGDHVGRVRVDEADDDVDQAAPCRVLTGS